MTRSPVSAPGTSPGPGQRYIRGLAEACPWPQPITTCHLQLAQPRAPVLAAPGKANSPWSPSAEAASANPSSQGRAHVCLLRHHAHWVRDDAIDTLASTTSQGQGI